MRAIALIFLLVPLTAFGGSAYRCEDDRGRITFQAAPCEPGRPQEKISIKPPPETGWQQSVESPEDARIRRLNESRMDDYKRSVAEHERRVREIDNQRCQYYRDQLTSAQERWNSARRQGYTSREKVRYEQAISDRQRDMARNCGH